MDFGGSKVGAHGNVYQNDVACGNQTWQWKLPYTWRFEWENHQYYIIYRCWIFHCRVWLPEGKSNWSLIFRSAKILGAVLLFSRFFWFLVSKLDFVLNTYLCFRANMFAKYAVYRDTMFLLLRMSFLFKRIVVFSTSATFLLNYIVFFEQMLLFSFLGSVL